jgi:hypothetical protein
MFVKEFLNDFQDILISERLDIDKYPDNFANVELSLLQRELDKLTTLIKDQNTLTLAASTEFLKNYQNLKENLKNKIEYINSTAEVYNKLNITYDKNTLVDFINFDITVAARSIPHEEGPNILEQTLAYNHNKSGVELAYDSTHSLHWSEINRNGSFHNSVTIALSPSSFTIGTEVRLVILKVDGTTYTQTYIVDKETQVLTIYHELMQSLSVSVFTAIVDTTSMNVSLNLNRYKRYGTMSLPVQTLKAAEYLIFNQVAVLQSDTYLNYNLTLSFSGKSINMTIPINNNLVCKRLDLLNEKEVDTLVGMYIKDVYTEDDLTLEYVAQLEDKHEKYIVYKTKLVDNVILNNVIKVLDDTSFKLLRNRDTDIEIGMTIEFYSFNESSSPLLKYITGFTKNG